MGDFVVFLAQALGAASSWLQARSPLPWPLLILALLPVFAAVLNVWVWIMRGRVWRVPCGYQTVRGRPCRNRVAGEWRRCHVHGRAWRRSSDQHEVNPRLRRWQQG
jgi:hypothetical protein